MLNRTSAGLRDALFDEWEALRNGDSNPARARSIAMLANSVLQSVQTDIEYHKYVSDVRKGEAIAASGMIELGSDVRLGTNPKPEAPGDKKDAGLPG